MYMKYNYDIILFKLINKQNSSNNNILVELPIKNINECSKTIYNV